MSGLTDYDSSGPETASAGIVQERAEDLPALVR